jgi:hypothetical protein
MWAFDIFAILMANKAPNFKIDFLPHRVKWHVLRSTFYHIELSGMLVLCLIGLPKGAYKTNSYIPLISYPMMIFGAPHSTQFFTYPRRLIVFLDW